MTRRSSAEVHLAWRIKCIYDRHNNGVRRLKQVDRWIDLLILRKNGATFEEIGLAEDITRERARQLVKQAIKVATHRIERESHV